jgi:hypothetical protein
MKRHFATLLLPTLFVVPPASADVHRGTDQVGERRIYWNEVPLSSMLRPDDRIVVVEKATSHVPPFHVGPPLTIAEEVQQLDARSDAIVVLKITAVDAELTSGGDWVRTRVRGAILEPVKVPAWPALDNKGAVEFEVDGGEVRFGDTLVRVGNYPVFRTGSTYLVTLVAGQGSWRIAQYFLIDSTGTMTRPEHFSPRGEKLYSQFFGLPLAEVTTRLRRR